VNFSERHVHWNSISWPYFAGGNGGETCPLLHGSMGNGANFSNMRWIWAGRFALSPRRGPRNSGHRTGANLILSGTGFADVGPAKVQRQLAIVRRTPEWLLAFLVPFILKRTKENRRRDE
jgi:hypothetical protein